MEAYTSFEINTKNDSVYRVEDDPCHYKVSFRYDSSDPRFNNKTDFFKDKRAVLFISVGQAYHEEGKFFATIELLNKYKFKSCDIVMADTLQRHNFIETLGVESAYTYAKQAGEFWLKRNQFALKNLKLNHSIIRWDSLLAHKDYSYLMSLIDNEYIRNPDFKYALHSNVEVYLDRLKACNPGINENLLFKNSLRYLIEELPIVMPMWAQMGYDFIIYPKPITYGMKKTYELFVQNNYVDKCRWIYMRFKKK